MNFSQYVYNERMKRGWSKSALARKANIHIQTITYLEADRFKPREETIIKIKKAFEEPGYLPEGITL